MKALILLILSTFISLALSATGVQDSFELATDLQRSGELEGALKIYEAIELSGFTSAALYANMAAVHIGMKQEPQAIWAAETCLRYRPGMRICQDLKASLTKDIDSYQSAIPSFVLNRWYTALANQLPARFWGILSILLGIGLGLCWYWRSKIGWWVAGVLFMTLFLGGRKARLEKTDDEGILMSAAILYEGPDTESESIYALDPGSHLVILDHYEGFDRVRLPNLDEGWVQGGQVRRILIKRR